MRLVLEIGFIRDFQSLLPPRPNLDTRILLTALEPKRDSILPLANAHHTPTNFIPLRIHRLTHHGQHRKQPPLIQLPRLGISLLHRQNKLAPLLIGIIFPHGYDTLFENVIVGIGHEGRCRFEVVENFPEFLDCGEGSAVFEVVFPGGAFLGEAGVVIPHDPFAVQWEAGAGGESCIFSAHSVFGNEMDSN